MSRLQRLPRQRQAPVARWFLPLMAAAGVTMSLTAPLEVLYARDVSADGGYIGLFMLTSAIGVIIVDVFGTRFVPGLDARAALATGLGLFGGACIGMGLADNDVLLMSSRVVQGVGGGLMLGGGLQAAVRVPTAGADPARVLSRFNAAFLFGGAIGSPGGLLIAGLVEGLVGYQIAFIATGVLALVVALALATALPRLAPPTGLPRPRLGLPRLGVTPGSRGALVLAMSGDFLRGGVLFTALPLAGAARAYSTITITAAIALMSGVEIVVLVLAYRVIRRFGVVVVLIASFGLGACCAAALAIATGQVAYVSASALFGVSLAGATASLPVLVVRQVGNSSAGLAKFRISAGIGILAGSVGCAVLGSVVGISAVFSLIAVLLLGSVMLAHQFGRQMAARN